MGGLKLQDAGGELMELLSPEWRYEPVPFVNGIAPDAKGPRYGGLIAAEILKNVRFTQSANTVLCSRPAVYSGEFLNTPRGDWSLF